MMAARNIQAVLSIVVIAASAGGLKPMRSIVRALPMDCRLSVFVVMHIGGHASILPEILERPGGVHVSFAHDAETIELGHVYVAPSDRHMILEKKRIWLSNGRKIHYTRPAADPLFISAARMYGRRVVGIVLSGGGGDSAEGLKVIQEHGGVALVQDPKEANSPSMPQIAINAAGSEVLCRAEIIRHVVSLNTHPLL